MKSDNFVGRYFRRAGEWADGKFPFLRTILLLILLVIWIRHLRDFHYASIFDGLNLGIHELGHFVFNLFGRFIMMAGGTILQLLVPLIGMVMFYRQEDHFAIAVAFGWLATNFYDIAPYVADARSMSLPLVTPFGVEGYHDWNYLLGELVILGWDRGLASLARILAFISMTICLAYGGWLVARMWKSFRLPKFEE